MAIFLEGIFSLSLHRHWIHLTVTLANPGILSFSCLAVRQGFFLSICFICLKHPWGTLPAFPVPAFLGFTGSWGLCLAWAKIRCSVLFESLSWFLIVFRGTLAFLI